MASKPKIAVMAGGPSAEHESHYNRPATLSQPCNKQDTKLNSGILRSGEWLRCPFQSAAELDRICSQELSNEPALKP